MPNRSSCKRLGLVALTIALFPTYSFAQTNNDPDIAKKLVIPPAPVLTAEQALKTFKIAPGYRIELVAAEPLVSDPVAAHFDGDGRLWVVEMRAFMPSIDGKGEKEPTGRIVVLEDSRGTGRMNKATVFLDKLVLPRAVCPLPDGALVAETGKLWYCKSTKGDLKCDEKIYLGPYGGAGNPEHDANGLLPALDNWIYSANHAVRWRFLGGAWVKDSTISRGQWGLTQDDFGRLYYNSNPSLIRGDLAPAYSPNVHVANSMTNQQLYKEQDVYPARVTPGVNRYYHLRPDGTLKHVTAACGPLVFRGDNLADDARGNVFVCEPAGNLIRRNVFVAENGKPSSRNYYTKADFLASTDERFRPVNLCNGPDGTLYIVDMYRGIIQHRAYITPFLRQQILDRGLEKGIHLGRIYRVVHESTKPRPQLKMSQLKTPELVASLGDANGFRRDWAQRLLIARADKSAKPLVEKVLAHSKEPLARLHALWTLEGLNKIDQDVMLTALTDKDAQVRASAAFLARRFIKSTPDPDVLRELVTLGSDPHPDARLQVVFTLGLAAGPKADAALEPILKQAADNNQLLESVLSGFLGREAEFLAARLEQPAWANYDAWRAKLLTASARTLNKQRLPLPMMRMLHLVAAQPDSAAWRQTALLDGLIAPPPGKKDKGPKDIKLPAPSDSLEMLLRSPNAKVKTSAQTLARQLIWPGKDGKPLPVPPALSAAHRDLYEIGRKEYALACASCHHAAGYGEAGKAPALLDSDWLRFSEDRLVRMVLHGMRGPITINREVFNRDETLDMPGHAPSLDDVKVAAILTYVRREWGEFAPPIEPTVVTRIRAATAGRTEQWTEKELMGVK